MMTSLNYYFCVWLNIDKSGGISGDLRFNLLLGTQLHRVCVCSSLMRLHNNSGTVAQKQMISCCQLLFFIQIHHNIYARYNISAIIYMEMLMLFSDTRTEAKGSLRDTQPRYSTRFIWSLFRRRVANLSGLNRPWNARMNARTNARTNACENRRRKLEKMKKWKKNNRKTINRISA